MDYFYGTIPFREKKMVMQHKMELAASKGMERQS
jgi:hypothetical protein